MKTLTYLCFCMLLCIPLNGTCKSFYDYDSNTDAEIQRIRLDVTTTTGYTRHLVLGFTSNNAATDGFDYGYDALNIDSYPNDSSWIIDNQRYIIQGVGAFNENKAYPLGLFLSDSGNVEFSVVAFENFEESIKVFIYDTETGIIASISDETLIKTLEDGDYENRFYLTFTDDINAITFPDETLSEAAIVNAAPSINYISSTQKLYIETGDPVEVKEVRLISILGQKVKQWNNLKPNSSGTLSVSLSNISKGTYLVSVKTKTGKYNKRLIIGK